MRKFIAISAVLCAALIVAGCASTPSASEQMASAKNGAPSGTLVGQATGNSAQLAEADAKYQLARAMSFIVKDMVDASVAAGTIQSGPAGMFRQGVNTALTRINLTSAVKQGSGVGKGKVYWAVYYMNKTDVIRVITQAVNVSKQANPGVAAFSIEKNIDQAYATQSAKEWKKN